ncbi:MAG: ABC transporter substrate-binding protein [Betaproteobacteria bacterium]|nr:ABC transporter substrate-binding protein [Betaproteobacteria bacterium]
MKDSRRKLVFCFAASIAAPGSILAQAGARLRRVAIVFNGSSDSDRNHLEAFSQGLRQHGYREGDEVKLEVSYADGRAERATALTHEALARSPDVIVVEGSAASWAAKKATSTIPIVMARVGDPVELGLVESLARPGGNITGNSMMASAFVPKALELLHESLPELRSVGVLVDPSMPMTSLIWTSLASRAKQLGIALQRYDTDVPEELDRVLGGFAQRRPRAVLVFPTPLFTAQRKKIIDSLTRNRIPAMLTVADGADLGGLMSYLAHSVEMWRNAASFVHRILKGAKPNELPVEQATRFELVVNLKTAKALGIKFPRSILMRADRVIE